MTQVTLLLVCELVTTTRNKLYKSGDRSELVNVMNLRARAEPLTTHLYGGFSFFVSDYLVRIGEACSIRARIKIAPVKQFLTQVTLLLACELVTTTRNKCYKGGDRSELANLMSL